ncbi:MAG TPA: DsbA family protein [Streptosporangiaceae bacterium]|nr:DsbA family protein [Streptosporangiaceae bacterium]
MRLIIYGDFNCPYSYLASQRAGRLARAGTVQAEWRAVEHDHGLAVTGTRSEADRAAWEGELAEVAALALPGEHAPQVPPPLVSNTGAAVAAYAEAVTDGVADELRRRLFRAIWAEGRHISSAYTVRRLVTGLMWPADDTGDRLASPDIPSVLNRDPDLARMVRRSGGTITPDGGPLTTAGWRRIRQWRDGWLALPAQMIPAVIGPDGILRSGADALRYLARLAGHAGAAAGPPTRPVEELGQDRKPGHQDRQPRQAARLA